MTRGQEIMAAIEKHAPSGYEPSTDDMTVPFAIKLAEQDAEIERLRAAIRDAHGLIDNDFVIPWIIAHKLDDVIEQSAQEKSK